MVIFIECPECACACACSEFQADVLLACERCGKRIEVPRWALQERLTGGGDPRMPRHSQQPPAFQRTLIQAPPPLAGRIARHIERVIGPCPMVFHQGLSPDIQWDLHIVPPRNPAAPGSGLPEHDCFTLITSGLSSRPMHAPPSARRAGQTTHVELMISLPTDWPGLRPDGMFDHHLIRRPENAWPIEWLKTLVSLALEKHFFIAPGAMIPKTEKSRLSAPGSAFTGMMVLPSVIYSKASALFVHDDLSVAFYALWPLYSEEMRLAKKRGIKELLSRLHSQGITDVIRPGRPNVAA